MNKTIQIENKRGKHLIFLTVFLFLFVVKAYTQVIYNIEGAYLFGLNLNKKSDREFGQTSPNGIELNFDRYRNGNNYWEKAYNFPHTGWSLKWFDHRNMNLGSSFCLNRHINMILWRKKYFDIYIKLSQGIMYASQIYESGEKFNKKYNNAIGQRLNFSTDIGLGLNIYPFKHFGFSLGATITHFSSGAISQPNDGLNLLMIKTGIIRVIGERDSIKFKQPEKKEFDGKLRFNINIAGGFKQVNSENKKKYPLMTISAYFDKKISRVNAINIGSDIFLNTAEKNSIENNAKYSGTDFKRIGVSLGHELMIGPAGIMTQIGYHIYSPYPAISRFYQKYGMKYYIADKIFATFSVRIFNLEVSDETVFGLGMKL